MIDDPLETRVLTKKLRQTALAAGVLRSRSGSDQAAH